MLLSRMTGSWVKDLWGSEDWQKSQEGEDSSSPPPKCGGCAGASLKVCSVKTQSESQNPSGTDLQQPTYPDRLSRSQACCSTPYRAGLSPAQAPAPRYHGLGTPGGDLCDLENGRKGSTFLKVCLHKTPHFQVSF